MYLFSLMYFTTIQRAMCNILPDLGCIPILSYPFPLVLRVHVRVRAVSILVLIEG